MLVKLHQVMDFQEDSHKIRYFPVMSDRKKPSIVIIGSVQKSGDFMGIYFHNRFLLTTTRPFLLIPTII